MSAWWTIRKDSPDTPGAGANQVWEAIYRENCFHKPPNGHSLPAMSSSFNNPQQAQAALDLRHVMKEHNLQQGVQQAIAKGSSKTPVDELEFDDECVEKRVFYRVISGMHASISTHLCWDFLNQTTGEWVRNADCYRDRLHNHPERVSNMYFNYALLLRAVGKIRPHIKQYSFCSADPQQDKQTKQLALTLSDAIVTSGEIFDESVMFKSRGYDRAQGRLQNQIPEREQNHGLCRLRQVPAVGQGPNQWFRYGAEDSF